MTEGRYRLIGSTASPYAIKLRALMRYRRIPFDWVIMTKALRKATEHLRPNLIPVLQYPDGTYRGESTTLAYDLEMRHHERSVIPDDGPVAFVCDLLEDLADEWAVKLAAFEPHAERFGLIDNAVWRGFDVAKTNGPRCIRASRGPTSSSLRRISDTHQFCLGIR